MGAWGKQLHRVLGSPSGEAGVPELRAGRGAAPSRDCTPVRLCPSPEPKVSQSADLGLLVSSRPSASVYPSPFLPEITDVCSKAGACPRAGVRVTRPRHSPRWAPAGPHFRRCIGGSGKPRWLLQINNPGESGPSDRRRAAARACTHQAWALGPSPRGRGRAEGERESCLLCQPVSARPGLCEPRASAGVAGPGRTAVLSEPLPGPLHCSPARASRRSRCQQAGLWSVPAPGAPSRAARLPAAGSHSRELFGGCPQPGAGGPAVSTAGGQGGAETHTEASGPDSSSSRGTLRLEGPQQRSPQTSTCPRVPEACRQRLQALGGADAAGPPPHPEQHCRWPQRLPRP